MAAASVSDRLLHIRRSIAAIEGYWAGKTFKDFEANEPLRAATERHLLIISEAVRHIPQGTRTITRKSLGAISRASVISSGTATMSLMRSKFGAW